MVRGFVMPDNDINNISEHDLEAQKAIARLQEQFINLEKTARDALDRLEALETEKQNALKYGIMLLGSAVISMGVWIFHQIVDKLK